MTTPLQYVRDYYGVPADINRRVEVNGKPGIIVADMGNYIGVNFDCDKPGVVLPCHPDWKVNYLEMGEPRKLTRGQQQYADYLEVADLYENFRAFLKAKRSVAR